MFAANGGAAASDDKLYVEDVFSTYLYTGNGSALSINNGVALSSTQEHVVVETTGFTSTYSPSQASRFTVDSSGNIYTVMEVSSNTTANTNSYIRKVSPSGTLIWSVQYYVSGGVVSAIPTIGKDGNLYIYGSRYAATTGCAYVAKFNPSNGALIWSRERTTPGYPSTAFCEVDASGNVYYVSNQGSSSPGLTKYSSDGTHQWSYTYSALTSSYCGGIALTSSGNILMFGSATNPTIITINSSGAYVSGVAFNTTSWASTYMNIKTDSSDNVYITFRDTSLTSIVIAKLNSSLSSVTWAKRITTTLSYNTFENFCVDSAGNSTLIAGDSYGNLVVSYNTSGVKQYAVRTLLETKLGLNSNWLSHSVFINGDSSKIKHVFAPITSNVMIPGVVGDQNASYGDTDYTITTLSLSTPTRSTESWTLQTPTTSTISTGYSVNAYKQSAVVSSGGMVFTKRRNAVDDSRVFDTDSNSILTTSLTNSKLNGNFPLQPTYIGFTHNGFVIPNNSGGWNTNTATYVSHTFRKAPKFFDVVTWTGDGSTNQTVNHSLGVVPGFVIVKQTNAATDWITYNIKSDGTYALAKLNKADAAWFTASSVSAIGLTSTSINVQTLGGFTGVGTSYVAYLFAHDTTTDGLIQCGSFTMNGSQTASVNLGWEPQYVLVKAIGISEQWRVYDTMRGMSHTNAAELQPNSSAAEIVISSFGVIKPTPTGFDVFGLEASQQYIYMAIRRGPMRVPTDGTKVFQPILVNAASGTTVSTDMVVDSQFFKWRTGTSDINVQDRLRYMSSSTTLTSNQLFTNTTSAESTGNGGPYFYTNTSFRVGSSLANVPTIYWNFRRAPGFFDVVCYTGTGVVRTVNHNLGVAPELMIVKNRSGSWAWLVYSQATGNNAYLRLDTTAAVAGLASDTWGQTTPTSSAFTVGADPNVNFNGQNIVAYLFASCPGVSKVGSYTGNGTNQTINCGFTNGARFVLIKRTDSTGDWYVWDTARGIVANNDPRLSLNTTVAEVTTDDSVDPDSSGFIVNQVSATNVNVNAATYIYLAIA